MTDFDLAAMHKAIRSVFHTTEIRSCLFHFDQALHRKYRQLGLSREIYKNDKNDVIILMSISQAHVYMDNFQLVCGITFEATHLNFCEDYKEPQSRI